MRYRFIMRTTLTIDDDVLETAKAMARHENRSLGEVVSDLARKALQGPPQAPRRRNGILLLPDRGGPPVTLEMVNALRDEEP